MATVEETMMKVQRILTGPMDLQVTLRQDTFGLRFADSSTAVLIRVQDWGQDADGDPRTVVVRGPCSRMRTRACPPGPPRTRR